MTELFLIVISTVFVNSLLLDFALGADPAMSFSRRMDIASGFSLALLLLLPLTTTFAFLISHFLLIPHEINYARTLVFAVLILFVMSVLKPLLLTYKKNLADTITTFYPVAGLNTLALGSMLLAQEQVDNVIQAFFFGLGSAISMTLVLILFTALRQRLETLDVPVPFKGIPVSLISLAMMSMGFLGFSALLKI